MRARTAAALMLGLAVLAVGCAPVPSPTVDTLEPAALDGGWASSACEPAGPTRSISRSFHFAGETWRVTAAVFEDLACSRPAFLVTNSGTYRLDGSTRSVPGAHDGFFGFADKQLTPLTGSAVDLLNGSACGASTTWQVGVPGSAAAGCPALAMPSITDCPGEYDIVLRGEEALALGRRPTQGDLCAADRRPTALGPGLVRT